MHVRPEPPPPSATVAGGPPDLLHAKARDHFDVEGARPILAMSFSTGGTFGSLDDLPFERMEVRPGFAPETFARDLFVAELAAQLADVELDGKRHVLDAKQIGRWLTSPVPSEDIAHRHAVFGDLLADPALRRSLEKIFWKLEELRRHLAGETIAERRDEMTRRLDILRALKNALAPLGEGCGGKPSALAALDAFGEEARASAGYHRLLEVLDYDERLATIDVRLGVGADGRIRHFELARVRENDGNAFWAAPAVRWLRRLWLGFRGYGFRELEVLSLAMDEVFASLSEVVTRLLSLRQQLAFYFCGLALSDLAASRGLSMCLPELVETGGRRYRGLFNPLLLTPATTPVASDVELDEGTQIVLLTGPNSGGKTRVLQALALTQLMAQSGFLAPAAEAKVRAATGMLASMRADGDSKATEGRLGTELVRVRQIFEKLRPRAFVVLDELCSGTNPAEAEEIVQLVLELLVQLGTESFVSTHFLDLASRIAVEGRPGLAFLRVELDAERRPTYRVVPGLADSSLARETAARLGVTRAELQVLVEKARRAPV